MTASTIRNLIWCANGRNQASSGDMVTVALALAEGKGRYIMALNTPLYDLIASVMEANVSDVSEDSSTETLEKWDSMRQVMLASALESQYAFALTNDEMANLGSVRSIRSILAAHGVSDA